MLKVIIILVSILVFLIGCSNIRHRDFPNCSYFSNMDICKEDSARKITIFFDGTGNSEESNTNVIKLHNMITLQDMQAKECPVNAEGLVPESCPETNHKDKHIYTQYIAGVGTDKKVSGNLFGKGIDGRVKKAYHYIARNYRQDRNDQIILFGFSRGSYSARILAGLIYIAELPNLQTIYCDNRNSEKCKKSEMELINKIYNKYSTKGSITDKISNIRKINDYEPKSKNTRINYMGIFDTVAALTYDPKKEKKIGILSRKYVDQLCNIDKISHAMSLDDNRKTAFPPLPMSVTKIASVCEGVDATETKKIEAMIRGVLTEVWFAGAHSDVGGGYAESDFSGVTLNWMIRQINAIPEIAGLLPENAKVYEDLYADTHIGEDSILNGKVYQNHNRRLDVIVKAYHSGLNKPVIHSSVIKRRASIPRTCREFDFSKSVDSNLSRCYKDKTKMKKNYIYEDCFKKVYSTDENIPKKPLKAEFTLELLPMQECFIINEPEFYKEHE